MKRSFRIFALFLCLAAVCAFDAGVFAQRKPAVKKPQRPIIFAISNDGRAVEPVAYLDNGKLATPVSGSDEESIIKGFAQSYYKPGSVYHLVFGGADSGNVTVKSSNPTGDCTKNGAVVTTSTTKGPLKGFVTGLATNSTVKGAFYRRKPTAAEKAAADAVAKAEFTKQKLNPKALRYINLTAIDVDHDGSAELVGSYWVEIDKKTRGLYFFIAEKNSKGKYAATYGEYQSLDQSSVMSGEMSAVDEGVLQEAFIDYMDVDGDGIGEIFTTTPSFEGAGFNVYKRQSGKWDKIYDYSSYHCAY